MNREVQVSFGLTEEQSNEMGPEKTVDYIVQQCLDLVAQTLIATEHTFGLGMPLKDAASRAKATLLSKLKATDGREG